MANLSEEPLEKIEDDKLEGWERNEEVWGVVQCHDCGYWGRMDGVVEASNKKEIVFVCPKCKSVERVKNPEFEG